MRHVITIRTNADRERAAHWAKHAHEGMRVEFKQVKRSDEQNSKLWAMLGEVASQVTWHGVKLSADDWKFVFMDALKRELRMVPNIDGNGLVNLGRSSSDLSKDEFSQLLELIAAFGANHGVKFKDDPDSDSSRLPRATDEPAAAFPAPIPAAAGDLSDSCGGVEVRHAEVGNMPGSAPGGEMSPSASKLVRVAVQGAALEPCAGVTPGPQEANPSDQPAPADGPCDEGGASDALPSSSLPEGWPVAYAGVLRRAQKPESLMRYAAEFWKQNGGWPKHRDGPDGATAVAIFDVFRGNFGNKDAIEELLRELV